MPSAFASVAIVSMRNATVPSATTMQSAATANGNGTSLNVQGYGTAVLNVVSSVSMSGGTTINFEASVDDTTWVSILADKVGSSVAAASTTTADGDFRLSVAGYKSVRARISAYSAGTITVKGYVSPITTPSGGSSGGGGTQYAEDAAHANGDLGYQTLTVRKDTPASTTATAGDYCPQTTDPVGRTWIAGSQLGSVSTTFTRPANTTAYTVGDLVGDSTATVTAFPIAGVVPYNGGSGFIMGCKVELDQKSVTPNLRIHIFNASDPTLVADNAALKLLDTERAKYVTYFDMPALTTPVDTTNSTLSQAVRNDLREPFVCASGTTSLWFVPEFIAGTWTPASAGNIRVRFDFWPL